MDGWGHGRHQHDMRWMEKWHAWALMYGVMGHVRHEQHAWHGWLTWMGGPCKTTYNHAWMDGIWQHAGEPACGTSIGGHLYWWTPLQSDTFTWPEGPPSQRENVEAGMVEALGKARSRGMQTRSNHFHYNHVLPPCKHRGGRQSATESIQKSPA